MRVRGSRGPARDANALNRNNSAERVATPELAGDSCDSRLAVRLAVKVIWFGVLFGYRRVLCHSHNSHDARSESFWVHSAVDHESNIRNDPMLVRFVFRANCVRDVLDCFFCFLRQCIQYAFICIKISMHEHK